MKLFAVLILFAVSCAANYDICAGPYLKSVMVKCAETNGASYGDIGELVLNRFARSEKAKCFRACVFLQCRYLHPFGHFYPDVPKKFSVLINGGFPAYSTGIEQTVSYCLHTTGQYHSLCDTTEAFIQCVIKKSPIPLLLHGVF